MVCYTARSRPQTLEKILYFSFSFTTGDHIDVRGILVLSNQIDVLKKIKHFILKNNI